MVKKIFAALALVVMGFFAVPLAANAAGYSGGSESFSGSFTAGGTVNVHFTAGSFQGGETVHVTVSGAGNVTVAAFRAAIASADETAAADGSASATVTLPADASGTYTVTGTGVSSGAVVSGSFAVGGAGSGAAGGSATSSGSGLADTGSTVSILAIWVGGGLVLLGAAFVAVRLIVRRQSQRVDA